MSPYFLKNGCGVEGEKAFFAEEWQLIVIERTGYSHIYKEIPFRLLSNYNERTYDGYNLKWSNIKLSTPGTH